MRSPKEGRLAFAEVEGTLQARRTAEHLIRQSANKNILETKPPPLKMQETLVFDV
jgi:hypothetical protein